LQRGQRLTELLKQPNYLPISLKNQIIAIYAATNGYLDDVPLTDVARFESDVQVFMDERYPDVVSSIVNEKAIKPEIEERLKSAIAEFKESFGALGSAPDNAADAARRAEMNATSQPNTESPAQRQPVTG